MFHVYIIYSKKPDRYYVGYSIDLDKRLNEHNSGISTFTAKAADWELMYSKKFETRERLTKENQKSKKRKAENILSG